MSCKDCNYCWQGENDTYPRCHWEDDSPAPCAWEDDEVYEEPDEPAYYEDDNYDPFSGGDTFEALEEDV